MSRLSVVRKGTKGVREWTVCEVKFQGYLRTELWHAYCLFNHKTQETALEDVMANHKSIVSLSFEISR